MSTRALHSTETGALVSIGTVLAQNVPDGLTVTVLTDAEATALLTGWASWDPAGRTVAPRAVPLDLGALLADPDRAAAAEAAALAVVADEEAVPYVTVTGAHDAVPPGAKRLWTNGRVYQNTSGGWLAHSPDEYPLGWTDLTPAPEGPQPWVQPTGAHDDYDAGAQVTHAGQTWTSDLNGNVWEPGVYGWTVAP